jgi:hypothetical protein
MVNILRTSAADLFFKSNCFSYLYPQLNKNRKYANTHQL